MDGKLGDPLDGYVESNGLKLHYVDWGGPSNKPMILLHGLGDCARSWDFFSREMCKDYRVIALDHRGHGDSSYTESHHYVLTDYVDDVKMLVQCLGLQSMVLVGHSTGGRNAFKYAVDHMDNVDALVIVDASPDGMNPLFCRLFHLVHRGPAEWDNLEDVEGWLRLRQPFSSEDMISHQAQCITKLLCVEQSRRIWKRDPMVLETYDVPDIWSDWSSIECPTLIFRGRQSEILTHEVAVRMREVNPRFRLAELEGGGHWFYQESPRVFESTVKWFLEHSK